MSENDVTLDDEAKQLKLQLVKEQTRKSIAETRSAIVEADLSAAKAVIADAEAKLVATAVNLGEKGGASLVPVVAAVQLHRIADAIAKELVARIPNARVLVVDDRSVAQSDVVYLAISGRIEQFHRDLESMKQAVGQGMTLASRPAAVTEVREEQERPKPEVAALPAATALASLAVNAAGLFKQEFTVAPRDVTIDPSALMAEIARRVQGKVTIVLPGLGLIKESALYTRFHETLGLRLALERAVAEAECIMVQPKVRQVDALVEDWAKLRGLYTAAIAAKDDTTSDRIKTAIDTVEAEIKVIDENTDFLARRANIVTATALLKAFDEFVASITTVPSGGTHSPLTSAILREQVHGHRAGPNRDTRLMHVAITASGGDAVTRKGLFWWSQRAAFLAAVQATYVVTTIDGDIITSGAVTRFGAADYDFSTLGLYKTPGPR